MLEVLKKKLGIAPTKEQLENSAPIVASDTTASVEALQASLAEQLGLVTELSTLVASLQAQLAEANATMAEMEAAWSDAENAKASAEAKAKEMKMAARRANVEANIGTARADAFLAATEMLNDEQFASVSSALAGSVEKEAASDLFKEIGVEAKADAASLTEEKSPEMKILESKFKAAKPAI